MFVWAENSNARYIKSANNFCALKWLRITQVMEAEFKEKNCKLTLLQMPFFFTTVLLIYWSYLFYFLNLYTPKAEVRGSNPLECANFSQKLLFRPIDCTIDRGYDTNVSHGHSKLMATPHIIICNRAFYKCGNLVGRCCFAWNWEGI